MESTTLDIRAYREPDHEIQDIFWKRWSPRALEPANIEDETLFRLFEAARWAPSSYNRQPWRFLFAKRGSKEWNTFFELLSENNRRWADDAGVLLLIASRRVTAEGRPMRTHSFDTGAAWQNLALQGTSMGLVVHGMEGFDYDRAREVLHVPDEFQIEAMAAIGRPGDVDDLPDRFQDREQPRDRRPVEQFAFEGAFPRE